jgi:ABC-type transport system involved in Fe-S cluster assembly fused permease/ATPase subunit
MKLQAGKTNLITFNYTHPQNVSLNRDDATFANALSALYSIDAHTDALIRQFIHDEFRQHTILWVAHRLESVLDFDRVVVMEDGCVVEYGNPRELIATADKTKFGALWKAKHR